MWIKHHDKKIELPDEWWAEAGMDDFVPKGKTYCVQRFDSREVHEVSFEEVAPVCRDSGVGIFNDREDVTARERVVRILHGFQSGASIPPIEIIKGKADDKYSYKLREGVHRLYCSLAVGFSHVPAVFRNLD